MCLQWQMSLLLSSAMAQSFLVAHLLSRLPRARSIPFPSPFSSRLLKLNGQVVTAEELGGADLHCQTSGVTDHYATSDEVAPYYL